MCFTKPWLALFMVIFSFASLLSFSTLKSITEIRETVLTYDLAQESIESVQAVVTGPTDEDRDVFGVYLQLDSVFLSFKVDGVPYRIYREGGFTVGDYVDIFYYSGDPTVNWIGQNPFVMLGRLPYRLLFGVLVSVGSLLMGFKSAGLLPSFGRRKGVVVCDT